MTQLEMASTVNSNKTLKNMALSLREEAATNRVFRDICHVFALRERTRQQITMQSLKATLDKEKFSFSKKQLEDVLKFMAKIGIGTLIYDKRGALAALKGIRVTLQSIGLTALGKKEDLERFSTPPQFYSLNVPESKPAKSVLNIINGRHPAALTLKFNNETVIFELPKGLTLQELTGVLKDLYSVSSAS